MYKKYSKVAKWILKHTNTQVLLKQMEKDMEIVKLIHLQFYLIQLIELIKRVKLQKNSEKPKMSMKNNLKIMINIIILKSLEIRIKILIQ
jgi:hypothetical protein